MFAPRRAFFLATRLPAARARPIAPFARYSTEAAAATPAPTPNPPPPAAASPVNADSTSTPPTPSSVDAEPATPNSEPSRPSFSKPAVRKPYARAPSKYPVTSKTAVEPKPTIAPKSATVATSAPAPATATLTSGKKGQKFVHTPLITPWAVKEASQMAAMMKTKSDITPPISWETSHHGISSRPVTKEQSDILMKPLSIEDIEVKPDGVLYLPEIKYRRKLNEVFGPMGWGLIPRGEPVVGDSIVTREYALIADNRFVSQAQGENNYFGADQLPSAVEGCKSNALMRCCKDLGIASELWDPVFLRWFRKHWMKEVWVEHMTTKKRRTLWYRIDDVGVSYPYKEVKR